MTGLDAALLAERAAAVQRHLRRVRERLPHDPAQLTPVSDATDAVVLHLDLRRVHEAALHGPDDLTAFLGALRDHVGGQTPPAPR